jgi:hypothetical protein
MMPLGHGVEGVYSRLLNPRSILAGEAHEQEFEAVLGYLAHEFMAHRSLASTGLDHRQSKIGQRIFSTDI